MHNIFLKLRFSRLPKFLSSQLLHSSYIYTFKQCFIGI